MKKIFTLTVLALFMSLSAMADWSLGNLAYNIKEGATVRMSKVMKSGIKVTFPEVTDNTYSDVTMSAVLIPETGDEILLEGVAGTYKDGVVFKDFGELQNDMKYTFKQIAFNQLHYTFIFYIPSKKFYQNLVIKGVEVFR